MPFLHSEELELYYEIHGEGPNFLFIPGTASDLRQHPNIFDSHLVRHFKILSFDPRGIGQSNSPTENPTMLDYATDVKKLLNHLDWKSCYVTGESFGGMIAQEFVINYPTYVEKLILVVTSSGGQGGSSFPYHNYDLSKMSLEEMAAFWVQAADTRAQDPKWKEEYPAFYQQEYQTYLQAFQLNAHNPNRIVYRDRQIHARKFHNTYNRLPQIETETYICGGRFDNTAPLANQLALLQQIKNSRLTLFDGSHMLLWQDPFAFHSIIDFCKLP